MIRKMEIIAKIPLGLGSDPKPKQKTKKKQCVRQCMLTFSIYMVPIGRLHHFAQKLNIWFSPAGYHQPSVYQSVHVRQRLLG